MTLVAAESHAEEQLRGVLHQSLGLSQDLVVGGRRILERRAAGAQHRVDELVVRHVARQGPSHPSAQGLRSLRSQELAVHLQKITPLVRPEADELGTADQPLDEFLTLLPGVPSVHEERAHLLRLRREPRQIEIEPTDELGVGAQTARQRLDPSELPVRQLIDVVVRGNLLPLEAAAVSHHDQRRRRVATFVADEDRRLPSTERRHDALLHARDLDVTRLHERLGRNIPDAPVRVGRQDGHLLSHAGQGQDRALRKHLDALHSGALEVRRGPVGHPASEDLVVGLTRTGLDASHVGALTARLEEKKTPVRRRLVEAAPREIIRQRAMIKDRIVTPQR